LLKGAKEFVRYKSCAASKPCSTSLPYREEEEDKEEELESMECVFGLVGNGFAIVVADSSAVHSILVHKSNEDKIMVLDSHKLIAASGEPGDRYLGLGFPLPFSFNLLLFSFPFLLGFNSLSTFRRTLPCISSVTASLSPPPPLPILHVANLPPLYARYLPNPSNVLRFCLDKILIK